MVRKNGQAGLEPAIDSTMMKGASLGVWPPAKDKGRTISAPSPARGGGGEGTKIRTR